MKYPANWITSLRFLCGVAVLWTAPFSAAFWVLYGLGALSDLIDGLVARALHQQSETGAKLDSLADFVFIPAVLFVFARGAAFPTWLWGGAGVIAALRLVGYAVGFFRFHAFVSIHTYANKFTGCALLFAPLFYRLFGLTLTGVVLCAIAFLSALEEVSIIATATTPNRDHKSIFSHAGSRSAENS